MGQERSDLLGQCVASSLDLGSDVDFVVHLAECVPEFDVCSGFVGAVFVCVVFVVCGARTK